MAPHIDRSGIPGVDVGNVKHLHDSTNTTPTALPKPQSQSKTPTNPKPGTVEILDIRDYGKDFHRQGLQSDRDGVDGFAAFNSFFRKEIIKSFLRLKTIAPAMTDKTALKAVENEFPKDDHERNLPTLLLYDEVGLKLFEKITYLDEYYLTGDEIEILKQYGEQIAQRILFLNEDCVESPKEVHIVELGSGNLRKVSILLLSLLNILKGKVSRNTKVTYYALDVSLPELQRTYSQAPAALMETDLITCKALHGTYDDGLNWLSTAPCIKDKKKCILWLGSSIGNLDRLDAEAFLGKIAGQCMNPGDTMLVGVDACKRPDKVWAAYNDREGVTREFILNGLQNANSIIGGEVFKREDWEYVGEWNEKEGRHQAFYVSVRDLQIDGKFFDQPGTTVQIKRGERVKIEQSHKYDETETSCLWYKSGLVQGPKWGNRSAQYYLHLVYESPFMFDLSPELYAPCPCPTILEWRELWKAWDTVSLGMIPKTELNSKPIDLRNPCIFYLGHIPTFLDIHVSRATGTHIVGNEKYPRIFGRGIDPDVNNPEQCHQHSEIPEFWPELDEVLEFVKRLRAKVENLYADDGKRLREEIFENVEVRNRALQRALWMAFEHEAMHLETLLYMLIQNDTTLTPPGIPKPNFSAEARPFTESSEFVTIPEQVISVGIDDPESGDFADTADHGYDTQFFGWDNEKPRRNKPTRVRSFLANCGPITNSEYFDFLIGKATSGGKSHLEMQIPATWKRVVCDRLNPIGHYAVRTVFGAVPLAQVLQWPVMASYDELLGCAEYYGGRIPTADEVRAIYEFARERRTQSLKADKVDARTIDAVNGHLSMNGVQESPPNVAPRNLADNRGALFEDFSPMPGMFFNVGFRRWCLENVTPRKGETGGGDEMATKYLRGRGEMGGAWEWTSTVLEKQEGFVAGRLYPEYTADFFDGKHNVVLGGSWATHPRIAGRRSFVNWYQRNYRYAWCTARIVKDLPG